jgi:hypothetical protein
MVYIATHTLRDFPADTLGHMVPITSALSSLNLFAVCGAGLAVPVIPTMEGITRRGVAKYHQRIGFYPANDPVTLSPFRERWMDPVLNPPSRRQRNWEWHKDLLLLKGTPDSTLEALFQIESFRDIESVPPVNYRVFFHVPSPALLFDFNTDGQLSNYCCPPQLVINPHGAIDHAILQRIDPNELLRYAAYGVQVTSTWLWFPGPEPSSITRNVEYVFASRFLRSPGEFVLLIGYSFGRQRSGKIDDAESFEFLREHLKRFRRRVVVLDPNPDQVAGLLEDGLRQRVHACKIYWNSFAESACEAMEEAPNAPDLSAVRRRIARLYDEKTR